MLNNGDKLVVTKTVAGFLKEGDIVKVVNVSESGVISFAFGENFEHMGMMTGTECEEHFKIVEEEAPAVSWELVDEIMENSEFEVHTVFDKCTVVSCRLPNGFVIVESSACVSPKNYNQEIGTNICLDKIANKILELEAYKLHENVIEKCSERCKPECYLNCCEDCEECNRDCIYDDEDDNFLCDEDECEGCDDLDCIHNPRLYH